MQSIFADINRYTSLYYTYYTSIDCMLKLITIATVCSQGYTFICATSVQLSVGSVAVPSWSMTVEQFSRNSHFHVRNSSSGNWYMPICNNFSCIIHTKCSWAKYWTNRNECARECDPNPAINSILACPVSEYQQLIPVITTVKYIIGRLFLELIDGYDL